MPRDRLRLRQARRSTSPAANIFLQQQQQRQGFVPTQPGDPDFSLATTPDTQAQFPAAAAEKRLYENRTSARGILDQARMAGVDISQPQFDPIHQMAERGFTERALTLGENLINFIDGPREAVNLLFQDLVGGPAEEGKRDPTLSDYLDALFMGIKDQEGFKEATGLDPDSGSYTLDLFGWDEAETWYGKVGRGIATFGFEVLTDPITYVTFGLSGLGRKVAKSTADKFADDMVKQIVPAFKAGTLNPSTLESKWAQRFAKNLESEVNEFVAKHLDKADMSPDVQRALYRFLTDKKGLNVPDDPWAMMELVQGNIVELAIRNKVRDEVMAPLLRRDFAAIAKDAFEDLPKYAYGGIRISFPFTKAGLSRGIVIPGTQGLGKKLVGDHLRKVSAKLKKTVPGYNKLTKTMKDIARNLDQDRPLLEGLARAEGGIEGWQYHILQTAQDRMTNLEHKERIFATMNALGDNVRRAMKDANIEDEGQVWAAVLERMERSDADTLLRENLGPVFAGTPQTAGLHDALDQEVTKLAEFLRDTLDSYYEALREFNPRIVEQYIEGYVPHVIEDEVGLVLSELAGKGGVIGRKEWQAMQAQGNPGGVLLDALLNAIGKGGRIESQLGASRYFNPRTGRLNALTLTDQGTVLFEADAMKALKEGSANVLGPEGQVAADVLKSTYFTVTELNEMIGPLVERLAKEHDVVLPRNWNGQVFKTNPLDIVFGYVNNLDEVVTSWNLMDALRTAGLAFEHSTAPNVQDMLQAMYRNLIKNSEEVEVPGRVHVKLTPEEDELARRARSNWAFDSTKLRKGVAAAIRRGDEAMAAAEPKGIPAYRAVREWDNIPDDELIEVYHATSVETAEKMVREGIRVAEKPQGVFDPDKVDPGLFVGDSPERVRRYGRLAGGGGTDSPHSILAVTVRKGDLEVPVTETAGALQPPTVPQVLTRPNVGATIKKDLPPSAFRILDEDAVARASEFDELVKERGRIGMEKYNLERDRDWGLEYDRERLEELTRQYDDLTRRMNEVTTTPRSRPSAVSEDVAQRADALIKWWQANADPQTGLVRALNADEVKALQGKRVGDTIDIDMASSDIGGLFAEGAHKEALGGGGGWRYEFAPGTRAAFNDLNQIEPNRAAMAGLEGGGEFLVSGRFTIESIDEANKVVKLKNQENILPYAPPPSKKKRVLKGYDELVAAGAMPTRVVKNVVNNKFKTVDDAKKIVELVARGRDKFHAMREFPQDAAQPDTALLRYLSQPTETIRDGWHKTDYAYGSAPGVGLHTYYDDAGEPIFVAAVESGISGRTVAVSHLRELTGREGLRVAHRLFEKLDELVDEGVLELSYNSVINMVENTSMTDKGADLMFTWLRRKVQQLDPEVKDILGGNAEYLDFQTMYDDFMDEVNLLFKEMSAHWDPATGSFVTRAAGRATPQQIAADDVFMNRIGELKKAARQMHDVHGFETAVKLFSNIDDNLMGLADVPGYVNPRWFALGGPAIEGLTVQPDIGMWLRNMARNMASIYTPEGVAALKMASNSVLSWWKAMATIARPSFHIRNLLGGVWNGMIVGVGPKHYLATKTHGITLRNALREGLDFEDALKRLPAKERVYWQAAWENDVLSGFVSTEFRKLTTAQKQGRLAWAKVWDVDQFVLTRVGGRFMESIEDFLRMSTFRAWFDPNDPSTAKIAKEMVEAVHFNYNKLTPMETRIKSLVPFFVWSRRNLPLQLAQFAENPRIVQRYRSMLNSMNDNFEEDNPLATSDYYSAFAVDTGFTVNPGTPYWARVMIDPDLPIRDLVDLPMPSIQGLFDFANNMLGPHVTTMFELNNQREFGDVNAPAPFNLVAQSLAAVGFYDRSMTGDVRIPYFHRTIVETALPFAREVIDPLTGGPTDPNRQARLGITPEDNPLEAAIKTLGGTLARGLGVQMATPADSRAVSYRSKEELDALVEELRLQGLVPPSQPGGSGGVNLDDFLLDIGR